MWFESYEFFKLEHLIDKFLVFKTITGHASCCYWSVPLRADRQMRVVGSKCNRAAQGTTYPFGLDSILATRSKSNGAQHACHRVAALAAAGGGIGSSYGVAAITGSKGGRGVAHQVRVVVVMLKVVLVCEGALRVGSNRSSEFKSASGLSC